MFQPCGLNEMDLQRFNLMNHNGPPIPYYRSPQAPIVSGNSGNDWNRAVDEQVRAHNHLVNATFTYVPQPPVLTLYYEIKRIGFYSSVLENSKQSYHQDLRCVTYLHPLYHTFKEVQLIEKFERKKMVYRMPNEVLNVMKWISTPENRVLSSSVDFIFTSSRAIRCIMNCIYSPTLTWTLVAIKMGKIILLSIRDSSALIDNEEVLITCSDSTLTCFKFNEAITLNVKGGPPEPHDNFNRRSFFSINKLTIGHHKVLYPTRIDCAMHKRELMQPIETMKTAQTRMNPLYGSQQMAVIVGWWVGAVLNQSQTIICGDKATKKVMGKISTITVDSLYQGEWQDKWIPQNCWTQLSYTLNFIQSTVTEDHVVHHFYWSRLRQKIGSSRLPDSYRKFIPSWFSTEPL